MNTTIRTITAAALLAVAGACLAANTPPAPVHLPPGIAWQQGDVDAAFAQAKRANKPLLLYWGAVWCPSCNQVKATIFSQQAFKDRSSFFVPVYLDGDNESAQKLGERFKVRGYPTMILFRPDGTEITRLPGEVDLERYMQALSLGMNAAHPVRQTLANALNGAKLTPDEWRMLADYSWDTDGDLPVPNERVAQTLQTLAQRAKADHANAEALRLELKAVVAAAGSSAGAQQGEIDKAAGLAALQDVLRDAALSRSNFDVLVTAPADLVGYLAGKDAAARARLAGAYDAALVRLNGDRSLSSIDRLAALDGRVALARLDTPKGPLAKPLLDTVRTQVAAADKATTNVYERAAVISTAADTLTDAGLFDVSDALLKAELPRSATPYYFMSGLAANAKARGDKAAALDWYEKAYNAASGPATRLRWGAKYFTNAVELAPDDTARIQGIANSLLTQVAQTRNAFYGANRRALTTVVAQLVQWNKGGAHESTVKAVVRQFEGVCGKLPAGDPQAGTCGSLIQPAKA